jgi:hypothetical protein
MASSIFDFSPADLGMAPDQYVANFAQAVSALYANVQELLGSIKSDTSGTGVVSNPGFMLKFQAANGEYMAGLTATSQILTSQIETSNKVTQNIR